MTIYRLITGNSFKYKYYSFKDKKHTDHILNLPNHSLTTARSHKREGERNSVITIRKEAMIGGKARDLY